MRERERERVSKKKLERECEPLQTTPRLVKILIKEKDVKQVLDSAIDGIDVIDAILDRQCYIVFLLGQTDHTIIGETFIIIITKEKASSSSHGV